MAPGNLPSIFNATSQDIEMLLAAQCHVGSKNLQVHMNPYLWKTRADGVNVINIGKTWYVCLGICLPSQSERRLRDGPSDAASQRMANSPTLASASRKQS